MVGGQARGGPSDGARSQDFIYSSEELGAADDATPTESGGGTFNSPTGEFPYAVDASALVPAAPKSVGDHLNGLELTSSGSLLVSGVMGGCSDVWSGTLFLWRHAEDALDISKSVAGCEVSVGVVGFGSLDPEASRVVVGWCSGPVEVLEVTEMAGAPGFFTTVADGRILGNQMTAFALSKHSHAPTTGTSDGCIQTWTINEESVTPTETIPSAHVGAVSCISEDNPVMPWQFASCSEDDSSAMLWDRRGCRSMASCIRYPPCYGLSAVTWDPDHFSGSILVVGDREGNLRWWDQRNLSTHVASMEVCRRGARTFCWKERIGAGIRTLAVGCDSGEITVTNRHGPTDWEVIYRKDVHAGCVCGLAWDKDGSLLSCALDGKMFQTRIDVSAENSSPSPVSELLASTWPSISDD